MNQPAGPIVAVEGHTNNAPVELESAEGVSLADIFRALLRNKWLILACTAVCVGVAVAYITVAKPVYEATGTLRIDPARAGSLGLNDLLSLAGSEGSGEQIQTEMAILKSDQVALSTLESLSPEDFRAFAGFDKGNSAYTPSNPQLTRAQESLLRGFEGSLNAKQVEGTQLVGIHFRHSNPAVAATIVNHVIDAYTRENFDSRYDSVNQVKAYLGNQMDGLRLRASAAQKKLSDFQEQNNLIGTDPANNTTVDRLKLLNSRVTEAEEDRIMKEAQMRAAATGDPAVLVSLVPDPKLQSLQQEEGALYTQYLQLSAKFGANYPPLVDVKQQLANVKQQISQDIGVITAKLKQDYNASSSAEQMLRAQYEEETKKAYALNRTQADYAVLAAEATSSRDLSDTLQYKLQQASVDAGLNSVNTMVVDRARAPIDPIEPKRGLILMFGLLLGGAVGVGAALLRETLSDQIQSLAQIESATGLPGLAVVPHFNVLPAAASSPEGQTGLVPARRIISISEPRSRSAESYRALRNSILLSSIDRPARIVLVTSSLPGEGKSSTTANYAVVIAQKGGRVLVVDADLRRPTLHNYFGVENEVGLSDAILETTRVNPAITPFEDLPNLHYIPAGRKVSLPSEALGSAKFHSMLQEWANQYDTVILDSAPILSVSDTVPLATWADAVVLVARSERTTVRALQRTISILRRANVRIAGAVLNDLSDRMGEYGYYYEKDYHGYYN